MRGKSQTFTSLRHGYSLTVTTDWVINETPGSWNGVAVPAAWIGGPDEGTDWFSDPGVATIEVGFQTVPPGTSVAAWESSEVAYVHLMDCQKAATTQTVRVAGGPVLLLGETCPRQVEGHNPGGQSFLNAFLVHGTDGVLVQYDGLNGTPATDRGALLPILGTLKFRAPS